MVDFLYGMNWRRFIEYKWVKIVKSAIFWAKLVSGTGTKSWYRYPLCRREVVSVPVQVVPVPMLPVTLFLHAMLF